MSITIDTDHKITLDIGKKVRFGSIEIDLDRMPQIALNYIFNYGLRQTFNDKVADKTDNKSPTKEQLTAEQIVAKAEARLQALYDGTIRVRSAGIATDEYELEAFKEMKRHLIAQLNKAHKMDNIPKGTKDRFMYAVNRMMAANGKPETTEREYLLDRLTNTKVGQVIRQQAIEAVDKRRAREDEAADALFGNDDDDEAEGSV